MISTEEKVRTSIGKPNEQMPEEKEALGGAFFWLSAFYLVYCARPEDWIPGLSYLPLAKISGIFAMLGFLTSLGKTKRGFRDLPKEATYLLIMIGLLFPSALLSPVWRGGAFFKSIDFGKVYIAWVLTFLLVTNLDRLRRLVFIQAGSVAAISVISIIKGHSHARLEGALGGIYSNPNDLAFAIVLSIPFGLVFLLTAKGILRKIAWAFAMLMMAVALFLTASRGGFVTLVVAGAVCLWHFGVKGRRLYLIVGAAVVVTVLLIVAGGKLEDRFFAMSGEDLQGRQEHSAYGSFEERRELMTIALHGIAHYPILGIGVHNFPNYSGKWRDVHVAYLQIAVEAGIPAMILYLMFFWRGFANLRHLRKVRNSDLETRLLTGALHSSLVGFVVGACFAPEAYQYFPYFTVAYTSVLLAIVREQQDGTISPNRFHPQLRQEVFRAQPTIKSSTTVRGSARSTPMYRQ